MRNGKLNRRESETLLKAWEIVSKWTEWAEENGLGETYEYGSAMNAVVGLCEFTASEYAQGNDWD